MIPLYLGVKAVIAKTFARIHRSNLINSGILPLTFVNKEDYDKIEENDEILLNDLIDAINNDKAITATIKGKDIEFQVEFNGSSREKEVVLNGGYLNYSKNNKLEV